MSRIHKLFGKNIENLNAEDLANYFKDYKKENNSLEFKSNQKTQKDGFKKTFNKVLETVCAFLNTDGGILIWGSPSGEVLQGDEEESYSGPLTPISVKIEQDFFTNRISSINPMCTGVNFQPIQIGKDTFGKETYCYVLEVKKSDFPPHQFNGTYYMRTGDLNFF